MNAAELWWFLPVGFVATVLIETPVLLVGLAPQHPLVRKLFAGIWLTACTYPVVILALSVLIGSDEHRTAYLLVAETFAPLTECLLFAAAFHGRITESKCSRWRDYLAIVLANLASFGMGPWLLSFLWRGVQ